MDQYIGAVACLQGVEMYLAVLDRIGIQVVHQLAIHQSLSGVGKDGDSAAVHDQIIAIYIAVLGDQSQAAGDSGMGLNVGIAPVVSLYDRIFCHIVQVDIAVNDAVAIGLIQEIGLAGSGNLHHVIGRTRISGTDDGNITRCTCGTC